MMQHRNPGTHGWLVVAGAFVLGATMLAGCGDSPKGPTGVTPLDQSNAAPDRELTQRIRQALVADDSLSTTAKNVKVIATEGGPVTLRGPVSSAQEKTLVFAKARQIAGSRKVVDELEVGVN